MKLGEGYPGTPSEADLDTARRLAEAARVRAGFTDLTQRDAVWPLTATDSVTGETFTGSFRSRMPTQKERSGMALTKASLTGGIPWACFAPEDQARFSMLAAFSLCLVEVPDWFEDPEVFITGDVPTAVYDALGKHFREFFRPRLRGERGEGATGGPGLPTAQNQG